MCYRFFFWVLLCSCPTALRRCILSCFVTVTSCRYFIISVGLRYYDVSLTCILLCDLLPPRALTACLSSVIEALAADAQAERGYATGGFGVLCTSPPFGGWSAPPLLAGSPPSVPPQLSPQTYARRSRSSSSAAMSTTTTSSAVALASSSAAAGTISVGSNLKVGCLLCSCCQFAHAYIVQTVGIVLAIASGCLIGSSFVFKKKGLLRAQAGHEAGEGVAYLKSVSGPPRFTSNKF